MAFTAADLTPFIQAIQGLSQANARAFFQAWDNAKNTAYAPTQAEIDAQNLAIWQSKLRKVETAFGMSANTIPDNVTVNQITGYLDTWESAHKTFLRQFVGDPDSWYSNWKSELVEDGNTPEIWINGILRLINLYGS